MNLQEGERLWVCDKCRMIGAEHMAREHAERNRHVVRELDQATSDAVRAEQEKDRVAFRAGLMGLARLNRKASA